MNSGIERSAIHDAELELAAVPESAAAAREFLRETLHTYDLDGLGDVTELLTTELVTNVIRHVQQPMTVRTLYDGSRIRVEVVDPSPALPEVMTPEVRDEHGRGLLIIQELSAAWGAERRANGKSVWFELDARSAQPEGTRSPPA